MSGYSCPGCVQSKIADICWHNEADWPIAVAIAKAVNGPDATEEMFGWFADDAEAVGGDVRKTLDAPYEAVQLEVLDADGAAFLFNDRLVVTLSGTNDGSGEVFSGVMPYCPRRPDDRPRHNPRRT